MKIIQNVGNERTIDQLRLDFEGFPARKSFLAAVGARFQRLRELHKVAQHLLPPHCRLGGRSLKPDALFGGASATWRRGAAAEPLAVTDNCRLAEEAR